MPLVVQFYGDSVCSWLAAIFEIFSSMKYDPIIGTKVIVAATRFVGLYELKSNTVWAKSGSKVQSALGEEIKLEMLRAGWETGWPYCMSFCEAAWKKAYQGRLQLPEVRAMLGPGVLNSWRNAVSAGWTSTKPQVGAIGCMQKGKSGSGHAFIVRGFDSKTLWTVEGNTSPGITNAAADREGDGIYAKTRAHELKPTTGLHILGFILPMS